MLFCQRETVIDLQKFSNRAVVSSITLHTNKLKLFRTKNKTTERRASADGLNVNQSLGARHFVSVLCQTVHFYCLYKGKDNIVVFELL